MSAEERITDISRRFARELSEAKARGAEETRKLSQDLDAERKKLVEELEQRRHQIQAERGSLGQDRARVEVVSADVDDEVLALNVGGHFFSTRRSTLCVCEGSYLANLFSGRWESSIERDGGGRYFLDFDPATFRLVLNFLRSKRLEHESSRVPPPAVPTDREEHFYNLVEYLGLTDFVQEAAAAASLASGPPPAAAPTAPQPLGTSLFGGLGALVGAALRGPPPGDARPALPRAAAAPAPVPASLPVAGDRRRQASCSSEPDAAIGSVAPSAARRPGWSRKVAHHSVTVDEDNPCAVTIADTRASAAAAAVRASRGFAAGRHSWRVDVEVSSDWSYVGLVSEAWAALSSPVGRGPFSWGVASSGVAYAGRQEVSRLREFSAGSRVVFVVDMDARSADVIVDGTEFRGVFGGLPAPVFPAVSNCRSAARYVITFLADGGGGGGHDGT